jgi:hypothetical protein
VTSHNGTQLGSVDSSLRPDRAPSTAYNQRSSDCSVRSTKCAMARTKVLREATTSTRRSSIAVHACCACTEAASTAPSSSGFAPLVGQLQPAGHGAGQRVTLVARPSARTACVASIYPRTILQQRTKPPRVWRPTRQKLVCTKERGSLVGFELHWASTSVRAVDRCRPLQGARCQQAGPHPSPAGGPPAVAAALVSCGR